MPRPNKPLRASEGGSHSQAAASSYDLLRQEFTAFEVLPTDEASWQKRKEAVRSLDRRVQAGAIALTVEQFRACRNGPLMLGRILSYLLVAHNTVTSNLEELGKALRDEWLRLQEKQFSANTSRMPLHYALEAYLAWLKRNGNSVRDAAADSTLLQQIYDALDRRPDHDQQPKYVIKEIQGLIPGKGDDTPSPSPVVIAAKLALAGAVIGVVGTVGTAVISHWDKLFGPKPTAPAAIPSQKSAGTQSPNISGAHDVTIQYGAALSDKKVTSNAAGKWRTEVFASAYDKTERRRLLLEFTQQEGTLSGTVTESNPDGSEAETRVMVDGKITGNAITFHTGSYVSNLSQGDADSLSPYKESYFGTMNKSAHEIAFKRFTDNPGGGLAETFIAKRLQ